MPTGSRDHRLQGQWHGHSQLERHPSRLRPGQRHGRCSRAGAALPQQARCRLRPAANRNRWPARRVRRHAGPPCRAVRRPGRWLPGGWQPRGRAARGRPDGQAQHTGLQQRGWPSYLSSTRARCLGRLLPRPAGAQSPLAQPSCARPGSGLRRPALRPGRPSRQTTAEAAGRSRPRCCRSRPRAVATAQSVTTAPSCGAEAALRAGRSRPASSTASPTAAPPGQTRRRNMPVCRPVCRPVRRPVMGCARRPGGPLGAGRSGRPSSPPDPLGHRFGGKLSPPDCPP